MKSTEFLTEAERNLAVKKLDKYLDMLSNDNLRGLIPLVRKSLSMNEADDEPIQYFGKIAPDARPASKPVSSPTLTAPVISNKSSEESKIAQVISNLSQEEKKELLALLQKEAKSRPASQPAKQDNKRPSEKQTKKDDKGPGVLKGCLLPIAGIIGLLSLFHDSDADRLSRMAAAASDYSSLGTDVGVDYSNPLDNIALRQYGWDKVAYGSIMEVNFEIVNFNPYAVKDIEIKCTHYGPSGTEIDSNTRTIYDVIPADGSKKFKNFNMGFIHAQAATTSCEIISVEKT